MNDLPPSMTQADLVDYLLSPPEPLSAEERLLLRPLFEEAVTEAYARRGNPRALMTPIAIHLARSVTVAIAIVAGVELRRA